MWKCDIENWETVDIDIYRFYIQQSEMAIKAQEDGEHSINNKRQLLYALVFAILTLSLNYIINSDVAIVVNTSIVAFVSCFLPIWYLFKLFKTYVWYSNGMPPEVMFNKIYLEDEKYVDYRQQYIYYATLLMNQTKFELNDKLNNKRNRFLRNCFISIMLIPFITLIFNFLFTMIL